ncbi:unnamed protein product [Candidula unifasciata]|uniref:Sodium-coupled monocarboxylate transporter 1 n=1 Tax=Candidula unifasciata TaxID=100452 RepID=A0A8S3ZXK1_9EUPU|nr:unnamed protein product [Candidula unifasciata]
MEAGSSTAGFTWPDYLVFGIMLVVSSIIGLYFGFKTKRQHAGADEMLTGNRNLPVLPVALSLSASFTSATTILGIPAEVYARGGEQWLWCFGLFFCFIIVGSFIVPFFHELHLTNAYEYLELRFNKTIRYLGSMTFAVVILLYMAAVLYAPAVALSQVTGFSKEISILAMGAVCTFYTSIGGIRAVVWTDVFQLVVVWVGLLVLMFKGANDAGGWAQVWQISRDGSRLPKFNMDPNPFIRHTFWTFLIGGCTNMMTVYGANQTNLQRYACVPTLKGARIALLLNLPLWLLYISVLSLLGLVMYAYYETCDPLMAGSVAKPDQLIPFFVLETMGGFPGLPGLFVAAISSASISTISSGINSLTAVTLEDVFKPCFRVTKHHEPSPTASTIATVVLAIFFGSLTIGVAYLASLLGRTAVMISFSTFGIVGGPLLGLLMGGMFVPFMNSWGAGIGMIVSLAVCFYVGIDPIFNPPPNTDLPLRSDGCPVTNNTAYPTFSSILGESSTYSYTNATLPEETANEHLYLSYLHYSTLALLVSTCVGVIVSVVTGCNKGRQVDERTYYKYSWCSSAGKTKSKYQVTQNGFHDNHKRGGSDSRHDVKGGYHLYSKNGGTKPDLSGDIYSSDKYFDQTLV